MIRLFATAASHSPLDRPLPWTSVRSPPTFLQVAAYYAPDATWESAGTDFDTQLMEPEYEILGK